MTRGRSGSRLALAVLPIALAAATDVHADAPVILRGDRLTTLPARAVTNATRAFGPALLQSEIPAQAWAPATVLPGATSTTTPALALADGTIAVGSSAHGNNLLRLDGAGIALSTTVLPSPATGPLVQGADGRVFVWSDSARSLYIVAPDGTLRGTVNVSMQSPSPPVVRADGSLVLAAAQSSATTGQIVTLGPDGEWLTSRAIRGPVRAVVGDGGACVWALLAQGLLCVHADGSASNAGFGAGALTVVPLGGGLLAVRESTDVQIRTESGALVARIDVGAGPPMIQPLLDGGFAVTRDGPPPELELVSRDGSITARIPIPGSLAAVLTDPTGALLIVAHDGGVIALEPNGAVRWTLELPQRVAYAAPAPRGGILVGYESGGALALLH